MSKRLNTRASAAKLSWQIIDQGQSLDAALSSYFETASLSTQDRGFVQELVYGVCRWYGDLDSVAGQLLNSPIRKKDRVLHFVLLIGLYQLRYIETPDHAAVGETVSACKQLNKMWAKNLINGCLRSYLRDAENLIPSSTTTSSAQLSHPKWIQESIETAWPKYAQRIFTANNKRPPMCLRVNRQRYTRDGYLAKLNECDIPARSDPYASDGIILDQAVSVMALPEFDQGACSVQDTAAQLAVDFLAVKPEMHILDACAAPGGKTAHILERTDNNVNLHALDISERRCEQLHATMARLELRADIITTNAIDSNSWDAPVDGYDRILIDAPCSGLGVIRRHPDIKHHRRLSDIDALNNVQQQLLDNLWPKLKTDGLLLYMTCSILPSENTLQAERFVASRNDAMLVEITHPNALALPFGAQTLPGIHNMDGFYYCLMRKVKQ